MLDAIEFMERMGGDAQLSHASPSDLTAAMGASDMAPELQSALRDGDVQRLSALLGASPGCALLGPPGPPDPSDPSPLREPPPPPPAPTTIDYRAVSRDLQGLVNHADGQTL